MKLLVVTQILDRNDPILGFFHEWVLEFSKHFKQVTVIALSIGEHTLPPNVVVYSLGKDSGAGRGIRTLRYLNLLYSLRNEYTHVFAHMNPEYVIGGAGLWRLLGKKVGFWYVHGAVTFRLRLAASFAHRVFTASRESCRIKNENVVVVGHGIDTELFSVQKVPHPPSVISVGRFSPSKRLELIIDAMKSVRAQIPNAFGRLVGDATTPEQIAYAGRIKALAKDGGVHVEKPIMHRDVPAALALSDVFFNASRTSSLDKAVLEAMSCGVIPVSSNVAYKPLLEPHGLYVEAHPEAFARRAVEILQSPTLRIELAEKVRAEVIQNHSLPRLMGILKDYYATL